MNWRKPALILLILAGIGLAVWGGYTVYKITTAKNKDNSNIVTNEGQLNEQNNAGVHTADTGRTVQNNIVSATVPAGQFKFVIEMADSSRAFQRYNKLKGFGLDIKMETADSTRFKLFFLLPASPVDTARMADSLQGIYTPKGQSVIIEK